MNIANIHRGPATNTEKMKMLLILAFGSVAFLRLLENMENIFRFIQLSRETGEFQNTDEQWEVSSGKKL